MTASPYPMDVERYLAGKMGPEELEAFLHHTEREPEATSYLADVLRQQALLIELLGDAAASQTSVFEAGSPTPRSRVRTATPVRKFAGLFQLAARREARPPEDRRKQRWSGSAAGTPPHVRIGTPRVAARPWSWRITAIAAAVLVAFGILSSRLWRLRLATAAETMAIAEQTQGPVRILSGGVEAPLTSGQAIGQGDVVRTEAADANVLVRYADGTTLALAADTLLRFQRTNLPGGKDLFLHRGRVRADVALQAPGAPMRLETDHAALTVRGTRFVLAAGPASTAVEVEAGSVELWNRHSRESVTLRALDYAVADDTTSVAQGAGLRAPARTPGTAGRTRDGLVALYTFLEGAGSTVADVSGTGAPLDLRIRDTGAVEWLPGGGLRVREPAVIESVEPPEKIVRAGRRSHALTVEVWLRTWRLRQGGPARIVALSKNIVTANFVLAAMGLSTNSAMPGSCYAARLRTADGWGDPYEMVTDSDTFTTALSHVALVREPGGAVRFHVNGPDRLRGMLDYEPTAVRADLRRRDGDFSQWLDNTALRLANEGGEPRPWVGEYYLVAIYARALTPEEVLKNFEAGRPLETARAAGTRWPEHDGGANAAPVPPSREPVGRR